MEDRFSFEDLFSGKAARLALVGALSMLALFLLVLTINAAFNLSRFGMSYANTITVEAVGEASAIPNIATISFSVTEKADTVEEAQTNATEKTNAALAFLKDSGIEEKDIKTTGYSVNPTYSYQQPCYSGICPEYREPEITGYEVSQSIEVKVRDTKKTGEVLQGLGDLSVGNIYGPNFTVDDDDAVRQSAREDAIKKAKEKARALAKELGVNLGRVVSFYENSGYYPMYEGYGGGGGSLKDAVSAPAPELPVGESESSVSVSITYEIW